MKKHPNPDQAPREIRTRLRTMTAFFCVIAALTCTIYGCSRSLEGQQAPAYALKDRFGKEWKSSDFAGRPTLVYFWATWAPPARLGMVQLVRLQAGFPHKDFSVVAVTVRDEKSQMARYLRANRINFPVVLGSTVTEAEWFGDSGTRIPTAFLVDGRGRVREIFTGYQRKEDLAASVERVVAESKR